MSYWSPVFYFVNWKSRDNVSIFSYFSPFYYFFIFFWCFKKKIGHLAYLLLTISISVESNQNSRTNIPHCLPNSMLTRYFLQYNINSSRQTHFPDNLQSISNVLYNYILYIRVAKAVKSQGKLLTQLEFMISVCKNWRQ